MSGQSHRFTSGRLLKTITPAAQQGYYKLAYDSLLQTCQSLYRTTSTEFVMKKYMEGSKFEK